MWAVVHTTFSQSLYSLYRNKLFIEVESVVTGKGFVGDPLFIEPEETMAINEGWKVKTDETDKDGRREGQQIEKENQSKRKEERNQGYIRSITTLVRGVIFLM